MFYDSRAVARYLKNHSPISPIAEDPGEDLSLNKILEGKTRKLSARMFFETLVSSETGQSTVKVSQFCPLDVNSCCMDLVLYFWSENQI